MTTNHLNARIEQGKTEILEDIKDGRIPAQPTDFDQLHAYVDANEYGGLTRDGYSDTFLSNEAFLEFCFKVQTALDSWIRNGMVKE
jgi:hypothetical protein